VETKSFMIEKKITSGVFKATESLNQKKEISGCMQDARSTAALTQLINALKLQDFERISTKYAIKLKVHQALRIHNYARIDQSESLRDTGKNPLPNLPVVDPGIPGLACSPSL